MRVGLFLIFLNIFLIFFNVVANIPEEREIRRVLSTIPSEDQILLENYFRNLVSYQNFGYVIFGNKPIAWAHITTKSIIFDKEKACCLKSNHLLHGYNTWLKYSHSINLEKFILRSYPHKHDPSTHEILIINKQKVLQVIQDNISLFNRKLGQFIKPIHILNELQTKENVLEVFRGNHDLVGIILGFGVHNSTQFQMRYTLLRNQIFSPPYDPHLMNSLGTIVEEMDRILFHQTTFPHPDQTLMFIDLPYFAEDASHPESEQIRNQYFADQRLIGEIYSQGNFLEITLEKLIEKD